MSKFDDARSKYNGMSDDEKAGAFLALLVAIVALFLIGILLVVLVKELLVPALIVGAVYGAGVTFFNWPLPKFVKKFYK